MMFLGESYSEFCVWAQARKSAIYFILPVRQNDPRIVDFCKAVLSVGGVPVIITNVSSMNKPYSIQIRNALSLHDTVRVYESAKVATNITLIARAKLFQNVNGGVIWIPR